VSAHIVRTSVLPSSHSCCRKTQGQGGTARRRRRRSDRGDRLRASVERRARRARPNKQRFRWCCFPSSRDGGAQGRGRRPLARLGGPRGRRRAVARVGRRRPAWGGAHARGHHCLLQATNRATRVSVRADVARSQRRALGVRLQQCVLVLKGARPPRGRRGGAADYYRVGADQS
jgi:hypothetical protein